MVDIIKLSKGESRMKLNEKIYQLRKQSAMSQDEVAEKINVSRQALSRWENGTAQPSADNIVEISKLFGVTTDFLLNNDYQNDEDIPVVKEVKKVNHILRANLIKAAIISQACMLNIAIQPVDNDIPSTIAFWFRGITIILLLISSIWMASNHRYEKDLKQRAKNIRIELLYCCVQVGIALTAHYTQAYFWGAVFLIVVACIYLLKINPKYMNRKLTK